MGQNVICVRSYIQIEKKVLQPKKHKQIYIIKKIILLNMKIAVSGASGKTGYRIVEEAKKKGFKIKQIIREKSIIYKNIINIENSRLSLNESDALDDALKDVDALIIATGARASIDLTGPARIDYLGVYNQLQSCKRVGLKRVILVSSLCTGKLFHPLNLFGLILIWKKLGENQLKNEYFDWTIIRPGGLKEDENIKQQNILYSSMDIQDKGSIPRRLVAKCCIDSLITKESIGKTIEITSSLENNNISFKKAMQSI